MAAVRVDHRIVQGLPDVPIETLARRRGMSVAIHSSLEGDNDDNLLMLVSPNVQGEANVPVLRPSPRLPLQDISHLFPLYVRFCTSLCTVSVAAF
ncbi:hypothetical protein R1flu_022195 [Riccia fluitans]|uniref:Uncharacterized protein n=1 Tax=Riccia fluitans TaxID=41844 RepID=A0ABD1ZSG2_9MARC